MSSKTDKSMMNQGFTTIDLILLLSIMFTVVSLVVPIVLNGIESTRVEKAQKEIRKLAHEAAFLPLVEENKDRTIASDSLALYEKSMGFDPWGRAYRKNLIRDPNGKPSKIIVWSLGPNGVAETLSVGPDKSGERVTIRFGGDDFGTVAPLSN
jgi:hypothetical protein